MNLTQMIMNDPVVMFSMVGLLVLFGISGFYVWYFISKVKANE